MRELVNKLKSADWRVVTALLYTAIALTTIEYFYMTNRVQERLQGGGRATSISLEAGATWAIATVLGLGLVPALIARIGHREPLAAIGYGLRGFSRHVWLYLGLYALMFPVIYIASLRGDFVHTYPFVGAARRDWTTFLWWEAAYLLQFVAVESFFRGYLLFTLERRFGWNAIFIMTVPYCMIHFHKPFLEAYAAIGAGVLLGALALRLRSFYGGAVLHVLVGLTMDLLGAQRSGLF